MGAVAKTIRKETSMPLDASGQYRHNDESAAMHSKAQGKEYKPGGEAKKPEGASDHVEIHAHGDGTFHTMHQGVKMDHPTHGHALIHAAKLHAEEGHKHFHAHHDGGEMRTHSTSSDQEPESRDGQEMEGAHGHMDEAMGEPQEAPQEEPANAGGGLSGLY
jgi:hypothetical protein